MMDQAEKDLNATLMIVSTISVLDQYTKTLEAVAKLHAKEPEWTKWINQISAQVMQGTLREVQLLRFLREEVVPESPKT